MIFLLSTCWKWALSLASGAPKKYNVTVCARVYVCRKCGRQAITSGEWNPPPVPALLPCHAASGAVLLTWVLMMIDIATRGLETQQGQYKISTSMLWLRLLAASYFIKLAFQSEFKFWAPLKCQVSCVEVLSGSKISSCTL